LHCSPAALIAGPRADGLFDIWQDLSQDDRNGDCYAKGLAGKQKLGRDYPEKGMTPRPEVKYRSKICARRKIGISPPKVKG
jgi:hypothetical protein